MRVVEFFRPAQQLQTIATDGFRASPALVDTSIACCDTSDMLRSFLAISFAISVALFGGSSSAFAWECGYDAGSPTYVSSINTQLSWSYTFGAFGTCSAEYMYGNYGVAYSQTRRTDYVCTITGAAVTACVGLSCPSSTYDVTTTRNWIQKTLSGNVIRGDHGLHRLFNSTYYSSCWSQVIS